MTPRIPLDPNFTIDYLREYLMVIESIGYDTIPYTLAIRPTEGANGHKIWVFKMTPAPIVASTLGKCLGYSVST